MKKYYSDFSRDTLLYMIEYYENTTEALENTINTYKKRTHIYKVEMERNRRKLTRIYKLFDEYLMLLFKYWPIGSEAFSIAYRAIEDMRKEFKNV